MAEQQAAQSSSAQQPTSTDFLPSVGDIVSSLVPREGQPPNAPQFQTSAISQNIRVYYLPATANERDRRTVMLILTLCGRCDDTRPTMWQTWVLTWAVACFPELLGMMQSDRNIVDYIYEEIPASKVTEWFAAIEAQGKEDTVGDKRVDGLPFLPSILNVPVNVDLVSAGTIDVLYAYFAMVLFIMGKSINPQNISAISSKRPLALMRKRSIQVGEYLLTGEGQIKPSNYRMVQAGWVRSTRPRMVIIEHMARLYAAPNRSEILDPIVVNMDMLRNSGQSYMFYIHELLVACPWCITLPALRSSYYHYSRMVAALTRQPSYLQPFYKLMMQDAAKEIRRRDIEPMIAVATFFAAQTRKTMNQYRINIDAFPVVTAFRELAQQHGMTFKDVENQLTTEVQAI